MPSACIASASLEGQSDKIADRIAQRMATHGIEITRLRLPHDSGADLSSFDGIVLGGSVHVGHHARSLADFVRANSEALGHRPTAFFSVSLSAAGSSPKQHADAQRLLEEFLYETRWSPTLARVFAGALRYSRYGPMKRWLMRRIAAKAGGDTDTSRDHEYTDWDSVDAFADEFGHLLVTRSAQPSEPSGKA